MKDTKVPTNDEEAETMLREGRDELTAGNLVGIYQVRRATGADVLGAYAAALQAHIDAYNKWVAAGCVTPESKKQKDDPSACYYCMGTDWEHADGCPYRATSDD